MNWAIDQSALVLRDLIFPEGANENNGAITNLVSMLRKITQRETVNARDLIEVLDDPKAERLRAMLVQTVMEGLKMTANNDGVDTIEIKNIPESAFEGLAAPRRSKGATVEKIRQDNGLFTLKAVYPDKRKPLTDDDLKE